jgi:hypothetical protein
MTLFHTLCYALSTLPLIAHLGSSSQIVTCNVSALTFPPRLHFMAGSRKRRRAIVRVNSDPEIKKKVNVSTAIAGGVTSSVYSLHEERQPKKQRTEPPTDIRCEPACDPQPENKKHHQVCNLALVLAPEHTDNSTRVPQS